MLLRNIGTYKEEEKNGALNALAQNGVKLTINENSYEKEGKTFYSYTVEKDGHFLFLVKENNPFKAKTGLVDKLNQELNKVLGKVNLVV